MPTSKSRWLHLLFLRRGVVPLLVLLLALPAMGIASAALFDSSLVPWFVTGGASDAANTGSDDALPGAAGMAGAHLTTASGNVWLPIVAGEGE